MIRQTLSYIILGVLIYTNQGKDAVTPQPAQDVAPVEIIQEDPIGSVPEPPYFETSYEGSSQCAGGQCQVPQRSQSARRYQGRPGNQRGPFPRLRSRLRR